MAHFKTHHLLGDFVPRSRFYESPFGRIFPKLEPWVPPGATDADKESEVSDFAESQMFKPDGQDTPDVSLGTETGVSITPRGLPLTLSAMYTMERYDFPGADERREQFDRISLSVGVPLQRAAGAWSLGRR